MRIDANLLHRRLATLQSNYTSSTPSEQQNPLPWPKREVSSPLAEVYQGRGFGEEWCNAKLSPETPRQELLFGIDLSVECLHQDPQNNLHTWYQRWGGDMGPGNACSYHRSAVLWGPVVASSLCSQHHCHSLPNHWQWQAPNLSVELCPAEHPAISEWLTLGEIISLVFCMEEEGTRVSVMR